MLNQMAAHFLKATSDIVPNWLEAVPDPSVSAGKKAEVVKIEMIVRGCLVGSAWREYQAGNRDLCGNTLQDGMKEYDPFDPPIVTPTTKADVGHDENITPEEAIAQGLCSAEEWQQLSDYAQKLFARGREMARARGLVLADTKYEFGRLDGKLILIDEVHTPDSSRYFYADSYDDYVAGKSTEEPKQLSKEFVRKWLMDNGYSGKDNEQIPEMTDEFVNSVTARYQELYEQVVGEKFVEPVGGNALARIEKNIQAYLGSV
jgi:phosphoribosylaminoimidazole-succinocarboxamide synthase